MSLWEICVLGVVRSGWNYDTLREMANEHKALRQMLGYGNLDDDRRYAFQTIKDNMKLLSPEHIDQINILVVKVGHEFLGHNPSQKSAFSFRN